jgi:hypothetical protein
MLNIKGFVILIIYILYEIVIKQYIMNTTNPRFNNNRIINMIIYSYFLYYVYRYYGLK